MGRLPAGGGPGGRGPPGARDEGAGGVRALITGGAGFIGCNLADRLALEGAEVVVFDALARPGVERNLAWLRQRHGGLIVPMTADVRDRRGVAEAAREADVIFHL